MDFANLEVISKMLANELLELAKTVCKQQAETQTLELKALMWTARNDYMIPSLVFPIRIMEEFCFLESMKSPDFR